MLFNLISLAPLYRRLCLILFWPDFNFGLITDLVMVVLEAMQIEFGLDILELSLCYMNVVCV
jgi:hypothetical protein